MTVMTLEELNDNSAICEWVFDVYETAEDARDLCEKWCESFYLPYGVSELNQETMNHYGVSTVDEAYNSMERRLPEGTYVRLWDIRRGELEEYEPGCYQYDGGDGSFSQYYVMLNGELREWNPED